MNSKSLILTVLSFMALIISWIVYASTIFLYLAIPLGPNNGVRPMAITWWVYTIRDFFGKQYYGFFFIIFIISVVVFVYMLRRAKDIPVYKILLYSAILNFLFGAAGLFFKLAGHGDEIDGFEWITVSGTLGALLIVWLLQIKMPFLKSKPVERAL